MPKNFSNDGNYVLPQHILWLGVAADVVGGLIGGLMLGIGMVRRRKV